MWRLLSLITFNQVYQYGHTTYDKKYNNVVMHILDTTGNKQIVLLVLSCFEFNEKSVNTNICIILAVLINRMFLI